jgi:hypothetical protein
MFLSLLVVAKVLVILYFVSPFLFTGSAFNYFDS